MSQRIRKNKHFSLTYNPKEKVGKLIEQPKITSFYIRKALWMVEGGRYLIENNADPKEIEDHLFKALQYHAGKIEEIRTLLWLCGKGSPNLMSISSVATQTREESSGSIERQEPQESAKQPIAKKSAIVQRLKL